MKTKFTSILKIAQYNLDELVRELKQAQLQLESLQSTYLANKLKYESELKVLQLDVITLFSHKYFSEKIKFEESAALLRIDEWKKTIQHLQDKIHDQFAEVKRIKLIINQNILNEKKLMERKEQTLLDEASVNIKIK